MNNTEHIYYLPGVYSPQEFVEMPLVGIPAEQVFGLPSSPPLLITQLLLCPSQQRWWKERFVLLVKRPAREALKGDHKIAEEEGMRHLSSPNTPPTINNSCSEHLPEESAHRDGCSLQPWGKRVTRGCLTSPVSTVALAVLNRAGQPWIFALSLMVQDGERQVCLIQRSVPSFTTI